MDQNTNQGGAQQGGQQFTNPFAGTSGQGTPQGGNPATDESSTTPPWLSFSPTGETQDTSTDSNPFGTTAFTDPTAEPTLVQPTSTEAPVNPWEAPAVETPANPWDSATVPETSAPSNPWETATAEPETPIAPENPWETTQVEETPVDNSWQDASQTEENATDDDSSSTFTDTTTSKKSSDDLLSELKNRFAEEEGEIDEQIQLHEDNIKMEQAAIRELKSSRKEQIERMRGMFQELKVILKLDKEEVPQNKPRPQHPQSQIQPQPQVKPQHPRPQHPQPQKSRPPQQRPAQAA